MCQARDFNAADALPKRMRFPSLERLVNRDQLRKQAMHKKFNIKGISFDGRQTAVKSLQDGEQDGEQCLGFNFVECPS